MELARATVDGFGVTATVVVAAILSESTVTDLEAKFATNISPLAESYAIP